MVYPHPATGVPNVRAEANEPARSRPGAFLIIGR